VEKRAVLQDSAILRCATGCASKALVASSHIMMTLGAQARSEAEDEPHREVSGLRGVGPSTAAPPSPASPPAASPQAPQEDKDAEQPATTAPAAAPAAPSRVPSTASRSTPSSITAASRHGKSADPSTGVSHEVPSAPSTVDAAGSTRPVPVHDPGAAMDDGDGGGLIVERDLRPHMEACMSPDMRTLSDAGALLPDVDDSPMLDESVSPRRRSPPASTTATATTSREAVLKASSGVVAKVEGASVDTVDKDPTAASASAVDATARHTIVSTLTPPPKTSERRAPSVMDISKSTFDVSAIVTRLLGATVIGAEVQVSTLRDCVSDLRLVADQLENLLEGQQQVALTQAQSSPVGQEVVQRSEEAAGDGLSDDDNHLDIASPRTRKSDALSSMTFPSPQRARGATKDRGEQLVSIRARCVGDETHASPPPVSAPAARRQLRDALPATHAVDDDQKDPLPAQEEPPTLTVVNLRVGEARGVRHRLVLLSLLRASKDSWRRASISARVKDDIKCDDLNELRKVVTKAYKEVNAMAEYEERVAEREDWRRRAQEWSQQDPYRKPRTPQRKTVAPPSQTGVGEQLTLPAPGAPSPAPSRWRSSTSSPAHTGRGRSQVRSSPYTSDKQSREPALRRSNRKHNGRIVTPGVATSGSALRQHAERHVVKVVTPSHSSSSSPARRGRSRSQVKVPVSQGTDEGASAAGSPPRRVRSVKRG
jgi:hypothetical protein